MFNFHFLWFFIFHNIFQWEYFLFSAVCFFPLFISADECFCIVHAYTIYTNNNLYLKSLLCCFRFFFFEEIYWSKDVNRNNGKKETESIINKMVKRFFFFLHFSRHFLISNLSSPNHVKLFIRGSLLVIFLKFSKKFIILGIRINLSVSGVFLTGNY